MEPGGYGNEPRGWIREGCGTAGGVSASLRMEQWEKIPEKKFSKNTESFSKKFPKLFTKKIRKNFSYNDLARNPANRPFNGIPGRDFIFFYVYIQSTMCYL